MTDHIISCAHCGAPMTALDAALTTGCPTCGKPWVKATPTARGILDLGSIRARAKEAADLLESDLIEQVLRKDVATLFSVIDELSRAVAGLNGECRCKPLKVKRKVEACPHYRAAQALRRIGVEPADMARVRAAFERKVE